MKHANPVEHINVKKDMPAKDIVLEYGKSGVMGAGRIAEAAEILKSAMSDESKVFFGLAGAMVPGGMKHVIVDMLEKGAIDVIVTTGANLTHDLVEALGHRHYKGKSDVDDETLHKEGVDRIFDSFMPNEVYETLEDFFKEHYSKLKDIRKINEFLWKLGELVPADKKSILRTCAVQKIPIFCPAIADSGIGLMMWGNMSRGESHACSVLAFEDMKDIMQIAFGAEKACVFYVGGGVPKNFIQQSMQFAPKGATSGVQITMDRPEPGGSSGAPLKEGISWGKMSSKANYVNVVCDATIALPLIWAAAI